MDALSVRIGYDHFNFLFTARPKHTMLKWVARLMTTRLCVDVNAGLEPLLDCIRESRDREVQQEGWGALFFLFFVEGKIPREFSVESQIANTLLTDALLSLPGYRYSASPLTNTLFLVCL